MAKRYSMSRQKACRQCAHAKARCDRRPGGCGRCAQRDLACAYVLTRTSELRMDGVGDEEVDENTTIHAFTGPFTPSSASPGAGHTANTVTYSSRHRHLGSRPLRFHTAPVHHPCQASPETGTLRDEDSTARSDSLSFFSLELICPIEADDIKNRWLNPYVPLPGQSLKTYPVNVSAFIFRALKSYTAVSIRGHGVPPFVHPSHLVAGTSDHPLSTCLSVVRICHQPLPGSEAAAAAVAIIKREMARVYDRIISYGELEILAAFQAYLVYSMVLFFQLGHCADPFLRQAMMNLQDLASSCARRGLVCASEQARTRPRWESWTVAEAKRRTLFTMYLFDSILATQDGLPTFLGTELRGLPAPAGGSLWRAESRRGWEAAYNVFLAQWPDRFLQIEDLWTTTPDMDAADVAMRSETLDHWLEDGDEFCFMLFAVTGCTHGC